jgi:hypothetical protein
MKFRNPFSSTPKVIDNSTGEEYDPTYGGKRCGHQWDKKPQNLVAGAHYEHWCGLRPNHPGKHICNAKWDCGETD